MIFPAPPTEREDRKPVWPVVLIVIGIVIVILLAYFVYRQIWIDTHCAMILGTLVCR